MNDPWISFLTKFAIVAFFVIIDLMGLKEVGAVSTILSIAILIAFAAVIGLLVNGTEYFLLGFLSIGSGAVFYVIFKILYGGLYKLDPENYPLNPKTRLARSDIQRIGAYILAFGLYALAGSFFLVWYEGSWGPEYYLELYETGLTSDFWLMIHVARIGGCLGIVAGAVLPFIGKKFDPINTKE